MKKIHVHICNAPWSIGTYRYTDENGKDDYQYGFARPENPHDFSPDYECCRPEEIAAHKAACEAWNAKPKLVTP